MENRELFLNRLSAFDIEPHALDAQLTVDDPDAMLLLVGTFNEQLATPTSDIDLLLIYPADRNIAGLTSDSIPESRKQVNPARSGDVVFPSERRLIINRTLPSGQKVQTSVISAEFVTRLQDGIAARNDSYRERIAGVAAAATRRGILLQKPQQFILSRFYSGLPLRGGSSIAQLRSRLSAREVADNVGIRATSALQIFSLDLKGLLLEKEHADFETLLLLNHKLLMELSTVLLTSVGELNSVDKLLFRLLRRHRARIGLDIVDAVLERYARAPEHVREDAGSILNFIETVLQRLATLSPLVRAESADWNKQTDYPLFVRNSNFAPNLADAV